MRELFILQLLVLVITVSGQGRKDLLAVEEPSKTAYPPMGTSPLEFLMMDAKDSMALMFGFQFLKDIRDIRSQCDIEQDQEEEKFSEEMDQVMKYIRDTKNFEAKYPEENQKEADESNLKMLADVDAERMEKLKQIDSECTRRINLLLESRKLEAMEYVEILLERDPASFAQLLFDVTAYSRQLQDGTAECEAFHETYYEGVKTEDPHELCYGFEIDILVVFILEFVEEANRLSHSFFQISGDFESGLGSSGQGGTDIPGLIDDEDYVNEPFSGDEPFSGSEPITTSVDSTEPPTSETTTVPEMSTDETTESIVNPTTSTTAPSTSEATETPSETEGTPDAGGVDVEIELPGGEVEVEVGTDGVEVDVEVGGSSEGPTEPTTQATDSDVFTSETPASDSTPSSQTPSDSTQTDSSAPSAGGAFINHNITDSGSEEISTEEDYNYAAYLVTYVLIGIVGIVLIGIFCVLLAICVVRHKRLSVFKTAAISEEKKISIMKQTGYVNPTYEFFDKVNDI